MNIRFRRLAALTLSILLALAFLTTGHAQTYGSLIELSLIHILRL